MFSPITSVWTVGNQWTYTVESQQNVNGKTQTGKGEVTFKVVNVKPAGGGTQATLEVSSGGKVTDTQVWLQNDKGLYQVSVGKDKSPYTPMQPQIMFPVEAGKKYTWKGTGITPAAKTGTMTMKSEILGPQEVDTDMGPMSGIAIESFTSARVDNQTVTATSTTWWGPKKGLIRYRQASGFGNTQTIQILKLKSFSIK